MQHSTAAHSELASSQLVVRFVSSQLSSEAGDAEETPNVMEPEPEEDQDTEAGEQPRIVGRLQCETAVFKKKKFEDKRVELSRAGVLFVEGRSPVNLTKPGTTVGQPKKSRSGRPFCVRVDGVDPACKLILDTGSAAQQQRWIAELRASARTAEAPAQVHREYTYTVVAAGVELARFTMRFDSRLVSILPDVCVYLSVVV